LTRRANLPLDEQRLLVEQLGEKVSQIKATSNRTQRALEGEAIAKGLVSSGQVLKKLKASPQIISQLTDYITDIEEILELRLTIIEVSVLTSQQAMPYVELTGFSSTTRSTLPARNESASTT
jgi:hypothetical protein